MQKKKKSWLHRIGKLIVYTLDRDIAEEQVNCKECSVWHRHSSLISLLFRLSLQSKKEMSPSVEPGPFFHPPVRIFATLCQGLKCLTDLLQFRRRRSSENGVQQSSVTVTLYLATSVNVLRYFPCFFVDPDGRRYKWPADSPAQQWCWVSWNWDEGRTLHFTQTCKREPNWPCMTFWKQRTPCWSAWRHGTHNVAVFSV